MKTIIHPVVGLGGTHVRIGFAQRTISGNRFSGMPAITGDPIRIKCPRKDGVADLKKTLSLVADGIKDSLPEESIKFIGIDAPGAWQENGLPTRRSS